MDDLIAEFIAETQDSLDALDMDLIAFGENPNDKSLLDKIFRVMHTIKGTCGFLGLPRLEKIAHITENLLDVFRTDSRLAGQEDITAILLSLDQIRALCAHIQSHNVEPDGDDTTLLEKLNAAVSGDPIQESSPPSPSPSAPPSAPASENESVALPDPQLPAPQLEVAEPAHTPEANAYLRVHVNTLEELLTMVSELVLTRNQLVQSARNVESPMISAPLQRLDTVVASLQDSVMKTRMQPIGNAWAKFPRIVHDIAREQKKKINLEMSGESTEIDRQVLEMIKDPLLHMIRNSADHGVETPEDRIKAGKKETGTIHLDARHEGGYVLVTIRDDGKGLSAEKLRETALKRGIASAEALAAMTDQQALSLIFAPGFSTAAAVTSISGRGVGMDVVRTNIEKIGGTINLDSQLGKGTRFTISIPLTLAIISALVIKSGDQFYAMPELAIQELLYIAKNSPSPIETIDNSPFLHYRGKTLPLIDIAHHLCPDSRKERETPTHDCNIAVIRVGRNFYGIIVDSIIGIEEIVVKPLSTLLQKLKLFSGNTIMGDGRVILILDPVGIATSANITITQDQDSIQDNDEDKNESEDNKISLIIFHAHDNTPKAVPAFLVSRIEDMRRDAIEISAGRPVTQYQGSLIELYSLGDMPKGERVKTLIFSNDMTGQTFGIMTDKIVDICSASLDIKQISPLPGFLGSAIINGHATDILDISHFSNQHKNIVSHDAMEKRHILILDNSAYFRHMLSPLLNLAGYHVTLVQDPQDALDMARRDGAVFDLIVGDTPQPETFFTDIPVVTLSEQDKSSRDKLLSRLNEAFESAHDGKVAGNG